MKDIPGETFCTSADLCTHPMDQRFLHCVGVAEILLEAMANSELP